LANNAADAAIAGAAGGAAAGLVIFTGIDAAAGPIGWAVAGITYAVLGILDLFGFDLFGGGGSAPVIPPGYYQLVGYSPAGSLRIKMHQIAELPFPSEYLVETDQVGNVLFSSRDLVSQKW
jgi:hypothetical protein